MRKISISLFSLSVGFILSFPSILYADAGKVWVPFICENGITVEGQSVYVVGNTDSLVNWTVANAIPLSNQSGKIYPTWSGAIEVPRGQSIEWKCIIRQEKCPAPCDNDAATWQPGDNNQFDAPLKGCADAQTCSF